MAVECLYAIHGVQLGQNVILKATTFINMHLNRYAIDVKPLVHQHFCDGKCLLNRCYKGLTNFEKASVKTNTFSLPFFVMD